jgi:thiamine-phosphate pyrophosphorylase
VYLVTDRHQTGGRDLVAVVAEALAGGIRAIQLREKDLAAAELCRLAERLLRLTRASGAALLVNDRVDVALAVGADGVQLSRKSLPPAEAKRLLGAAGLVGVSCHSAVDVAEAAGAGADFAVLGPLYATPSKAPYGPPLSPAAVAAARATGALPILGIGGIKTANAAEVIAAGAHGVAVISAITAAPDPAGAARELLQAWQAARQGTRALGEPGAPARR